MNVTYVTIKSTVIIRSLISNEGPLKPLNSSRQSLEVLFFRLYMVKKSTIQKKQICQPQICSILSDNIIKKSAPKKGTDCIIIAKYAFITL